jgi:hypothetical protein
MGEENGPTCQYWEFVSLLPILFNVKKSWLYVESGVSPPGNVSIP